jgi:hypothetical protein
MPALVVIDKRGRVYDQHHGNSMSDIPPNAQILALLDELNKAEAQEGGNRPSQTTPT